MALALASLDSSGAVSKKLTFNQTFFCSGHESVYRVSPVSIPRAHGDRTPDTVYLSGKTIQLTGWVGTGKASGLPGTPNRTSSGGSVMGYTTDSRTPAQFLYELRRFFADLHWQQTIVLDYGNGWFQFVKVQQIQDAIEEGVPDLRHIAITLYAADPLAYSTTLVSINTTDVSWAGKGAYIQPVAGGTIASYNYRLVLTNLDGANAKVVRIATSGNANVCTLTMAAGATLTVDAYRRVVETGTPAEPAWSVWKAGGMFLPLNPNNDTTDFWFFDDATGTLLTWETDLHAQFDGRGADPLADSTAVPAIPAVGQYGTGQYGVSQYG